MPRGFLLLTAVFFYPVLGFNPPALAGNGTIDVNAKTMDLTVLFTYSESDDNLDGASATTWKQVFNAGSKRLWNATNGQLRLGTITAYVRALDKKDDADVWILKSGDTAYTTDVSSLGVPGQHMAFNSTNHLSISGTKLADCSIAHEIGHYVFGLYDEYTGYVVPSAKQANYTEADGVEIQGHFPDVFFSVSTDSPVAAHGCRRHRSDQELAHGVRHGVQREQRG